MCLLGLQPSLTGHDLALQDALLTQSFHRFGLHVFWESEKCIHTLLKLIVYAN